MASFSFGARWQLLIEQGYLQVFSSNVLFQLLGFGSVILVAKFLPPNDLALVRTAQAYAAVLVIVAGWGLTTPVLRYCADTAYTLSVKRLFLGFALSWVGIISIGVVVLSVAAAIGFADVQRVAGVYAGYALAIPALAVSSLLFVYLQARQEFSLLARNQSLIKLASVAVVVIATWKGGLVGFVVATVIVTYLGTLPLLRATRPTLGLRQAEQFPENFNRLALYSMGGMLITALGQSSDFILLEYLKADRSVVGRYSLASIFLMGAATLTGSIQGVVTPKFTALLSEPESFLHNLRRWTVNTALISVVVAFGCLSVAWSLEQWFFDDHYRGFTGFLSVMMLKYVVWSTYAIAGAAMVGAGLIKSGTWIALLTTAIAFTAGFPLIRHYGAWGAAWTQVVVALISLVLVWWIQRIGFRSILDKTVDKGGDERREAY